MSRRSVETAPAGSMCAACGQPCTEMDATVVMHGDCVKWVKDVMARDMRPYRPSEYGGGGERS